MSASYSTDFPLIPVHRTRGSLGATVSCCPVTERSQVQVLDPAYAGALCNRAVLPVHRTRTRELSKAMAH